MTDQESRSLATKDHAEKPPLVVGNGVRAIIPQDIEQAYRLAALIHASKMAPKDMDTPEKIVVAIMHGAEIGLPPMQALQSIAVINGRPTVWGDGALSLVRASGLLEDFDEQVIGEGDGRRAICMAIRRGQATPIRHEFSVAHAKEAGLWGKNVWKQYPERMLQMRARSWVLRDGFADVLRGLGVAEEVSDFDARIIPPRPYGGSGGTTARYTLEPTVVTTIKTELDPEGSPIEPELDPIEKMVGRLPETEEAK